MTIPSTKTQLLVAENWTKIYQSFRNADFQSYDFDTLRRTMITYLRETYPEEFNDYIDSSEYIALIDLIAYLGQNLSFRIDLNARENFLETAQRKDSVLRLAQLISYNPKRNTPAHGQLKISALSTTESVVDANGLNLANQVIAWNDPTNTNWYQQFVSILNSAMPASSVFGRPDDKSVIGGISTEQYKVNSVVNDLPIFSVTKNINGVSMTFEICGATFKDRDFIYEEVPLPRGPFSYVFQNDNQGAGSSNSGFFVHFRQGTIASTGFSIATPVPNEIIGINASGINDEDVWLWQLTPSGTYDKLWTRVDALVGNNAIYNNIAESIRTFYSVSSRNNDQIDLNFADGAFGDLPKGNFRLFYRQSNGQTYTITPDQMAGINITIPYVNKEGNVHQLTMTLTLQYTVTNSSGPESIASIKAKAPQTYYLQNRMVTAEDYNIGPLTAGNSILKVSSVNRVSSGISKYFELSDISGKYSSTDIFAKDGILYKEETLPTFEFKFQSRNEVFAALKNQLEPIVLSNKFKNFYLDKSRYPRPSFTALKYSWKVGTSDVSQSTGYFIDANGIPVQTGYFSGNNATYISQGALIKFIAPANYAFKSGKLVPIDLSDTEQTAYIWSKVIQVVGDGTNQLRGLLNNGTGPIIVSGKIPEGSFIDSIIPNFVNVFSYALETQIVNLCVVQRNFGLSFDRVSRQWFIIVDSNLDAVSPFSLTYQGDVSNTQKDSSWLILFQWTGSSYRVTYRMSEYIFESDKQTAFFVDYNNNNYDYITDTVIKDSIEVLGINSAPNNKSKGLGIDYRWQIDNTITEVDGYINPKKVAVSFYLSNENGQIDNPDAFDEIVNPDKVDAAGVKQNFVYFKISDDGVSYNLMTDQTLITPYYDESYVGNSEEDQLYYFYGKDVVKRYSLGQFVIEPLYFARTGRSNLKFHYIHNSGEERRIDPSKTNIIDVYVLTQAYDNAYKRWLAAGVGSQPLVPTSQSLENDFSSALEPIKSISDSLIYHSARYKLLFGPLADSKLQATIKVVRNPSRSTSDNDLKSRILSAINSYFSVDYFEFGETFYWSELSTYIMNIMTPDIVGIVIVPKDPTLPFGSLFEISCQPNEIFLSGATANEIEVIDAITTSEINATSSINNSSAGV